MTGTTRSILPLLLLAFLAAGCVRITQPYVETNFYTLEYLPPELAGLPPRPVTLQVERFTASPLYDTDRIIYRDRAHVRNAYAYHRWRSRPGNLVRDLLLRDLRSSNLFSAVLTDSIGRADYLLAGNVEEILEWDENGSWEAVLTLSVSLLARKGAVSPEVLWQQTFSARHPAARKDPQAVVEAMSRSMAEISEEIIRAVHEAIPPP